MTNDRPRMPYLDTTEAMVEHLLEHHDESSRDLIDWLADDSENHPTRTVEWHLDHLHQVQHDSLDWDAGHDHGPEVG